MRRLVTVAAGAGVLAEMLLRLTESDVEGLR